MNKKFLAIFSLAFIGGLAMGANYISANTYENQFEGPCDGTCTTNDNMATLEVQTDNTIVMDTGSTGYCGRAGVEEQWEITGSGDEAQIDVNWRGDPWSSTFAIVVNHDSGSEEIFYRNNDGSSSSYDGTVTHDIGQYAGQTVMIDYYFEDISSDWCDMGDHDQDATISTQIVSTNSAPNSPSNPTPANNQDGVSINSDLEVDVSDPEGDSMDVEFYVDGSLEGTDTGVCSGCTASINPSLSTGQSYNWYAVADDGSATTQSSTWSFTTIHEPEFDEVSASPQLGTEASTSPELSIDVSHQDSLEMDVYFYLNDTFVGEESVVGSGTATVNAGNLDANEDYEWYVEVADENGRTVDNQASPWIFETDTGQPGVTVEYGNDVNVNPYQGVLQVRPEHSHATTVDYVRLLNGTQDVVDEVENAEVGETLSLLWPDLQQSSPNSLEQDRLYNWYAEVEHSGETEVSSVQTFTTFTVGINLVDEVPEADSYRIYRRNQSSGDSFDYGDADFEYLGSGTGTSLIDASGSLAEDSYCYRITAQNLAGESEPSSEQCTPGALTLQ